MAKTTRNAQKEGVRGGLQAAIAFLIAFIALRYGILLSIFFAGVGGFTVGFILRWWRSSEGSKPKLHPFANVKLKPAKRYPGLADIGSRQSSRGDLYIKQKSSDDNSPEE
ncbi:hypothetical protein [[Limnothrix rosea] IAM M-220]|uniref:hypothetical protein n=1 Tax=[Limnothrix rosea] IAM M-220 TaxID=454133 RepID=UPI00096379C3|nr:hypothetical protein [[Limnothrix rosea] IAM M-220]OKH11514.1 hypothetical protein NIES208_17140 [[Limnothrix rosea] IAM M-220]